MTKYEEVKTLLENEPKGRERSHKNRALAYIIRRKYQQMFAIDNDLVADIIAEASSYDRAWRMVLMENEHLRGSDYEENQVLEEIKQLELGYTPGYNKDIK